MAETPKRMKGMGRVAFIAARDEIAAELAAGWPVKAIYQRRAAQLGIGYPQFTRYVAKLIRPPGKMLVSEPPSVPPAPSAAPNNHQRFSATNEGSKPDAGHEPAARPTFSHHGIVQEGEVERLLGPGYLPKRR
jgi:hypothetical protein